MRFEVCEIAQKIPSDLPKPKQARGSQVFLRLEAEEIQQTYDVINEIVMLGMFYPICLKILFYRRYADAGFPGRNIVIVPEHRCNAIVAIIVIKAEIVRYR